MQVYYSVVALVMGTIGGDRWSVVSDILLLLNCLLVIDPVLAMMIFNLMKRGRQSM